MLVCSCTTLYVCVCRLSVHLNAVRAVVTTAVDNSW